MVGLVHDFGIVAILVVIAFCAKYAITFLFRIPKPRGRDLEVTHQIKGVEASDPKQAMNKAYNTLSDQQKKQVVKVYMKRDDGDN